MSERCAVADVATAAYCGRKAYLARDDEGGEPPVEQRAVRELAYHYPALLDRPRATVRRVFAERDADPDVVDVARIVEGLADRHDDPLWDAVARPWREETVLRSERLVGRLDKVLRVGDGGGDPAVLPSWIAAGYPPDDGVWRSHRVRCAALHRLLVAEGFDADGRAVVEYPRVGAVRVVRLRDRDRRGLADALDVLDAAERGHPPSRTDNPSKCNACRFRERCGVPTRSLASRLRERLPGPD